MGTTSNYGLRYPDASASNNVPGDLQNLAADTDATIKAVHDALASLTTAAGANSSAWSTSTSNPVFSFVLTTGVWLIDFQATLTVLGPSGTPNIQLTTASGSGYTLAGALSARGNAAVGNPACVSLRFRVVVTSASVSLPLNAVLSGTGANVSTGEAGYTALKVA